MTGVGFLGAGAVIQTKRAVYGLTTAATIWMVAALGMAVATDYWAIAIIMTVLTSGMLVLLGPLSAWLAAKSEVRTVRREKHFHRMVEEGLRREESRNQ